MTCLQLGSGSPSRATGAATLGLGEAVCGQSADRPSSPVAIARLALAVPRFEGVARHEPLI